MALKGDRDSYAIHETTFHLDEVAERGNIVCISTVGSGTALDQGAALVTIPANQSGTVPVGILLNDMVNKDLTQTHLNWFKDECQKGSKVTIGRKGWFVTDRVLGTPTAGQTAYLTSSGMVTATLGAGGLVQTPKVGMFLSTKDEDGFIKVYVDLPN